MPRIGWTPSIVPKGDDQNVYLVVDDLAGMAGSIGNPTSRPPIWKTVILDLLEGQYKNPVRVVCFNTAEKWSEDVSGDVAQELSRRCDLQLRDVPSYLEDFVQRHDGQLDRQLTLRLA
jgi:hypothetical protein